MEWMSDILLNRQKDKRQRSGVIVGWAFSSWVSLPTQKALENWIPKWPLFKNESLSHFLIHSMKCLKWELIETSLDRSLSICQKMKAPVPLYNWMTQCHELSFANGIEGQDTWAPFTKCKLAQRCLMFCHKAENKKVLDIPAFPPQNTSKLSAVKQ